MIIKGDWHKKIGKVKHIYFNVYTGKAATTLKDMGRRAPPAAVSSVLSWQIRPTKKIYPENRWVHYYKKKRLGT